MKFNILKHFNVWSILFLICIVTFFSYANVLNGEFQFDDRYTIIENDSIKNLDSPLRINWLERFLSGGRPVTDFTFSLNYRWGRLDVFGYHLVNILIHIGVVIVVYLFMRKTIRLTEESHPIPLPLTCHSRENGNPESKELDSCFRRNDNLFIGQNTRIELLSLTVAAIFALHPIQTQAVSYISQRAEVLNALFYIGSIMLFIKSIETNRALKRILLYLGGLVLFILSFGSKPTAISLPVILLLYDYYFLKKSSLIKRLIYSGPLIIGGMAIVVSVLTKIVGSPYIGYSIETITPYSYLLTQMRVFLTYIRLIILPMNQNLDYNYPVYHSFFDLEVFLSFLFLLLLFGLAVYLFYRSRFTVINPPTPPFNINPPTPPFNKGGQGGIISDSRLISFGILWFFIVLLPTSSVIPQRDVIMEHRLYLPSLGLILSLTIAGRMVLNTIFDKYQVSRRYGLSLIVVISILSVLAFSTNRRNAVWQDDLTLQKDVVLKSQGKPRAHYNLGTAFLKRGYYMEALSEFKKAIEARDDGSITREKIFINMGVTLLRMERADEAIDVFREGLKYFPANPGLLDNMAIALKKKGRHDEAIRYANQSLMMNPRNSDMHSLIGKIYYEQGSYEKAIEYYKKALEVNPDDLLISWDIALILDRMGRSEEASLYYKRYLSRETEGINPKDPVER
jgi:Flp pilus assembly protein TadD